MFAGVIAAGDVGEAGEVAEFHDLGGRRLNVVRARDGDCFEALEGSLVTRRPEVRRQVRVVEPRPVRPREVAATVGTSQR